MKKIISLYSLSILAGLLFYKITNTVLIKTSTPSSSVFTSNWMTYTNPGIGLSLRHPATMKTIVSKIDSESNRVIITDMEVDDYGRPKNNYILRQGKDDPVGGPPVIYKGFYFSVGANILLGKEYIIKTIQSDKNYQKRTINGIILYENVHSTSIGLNKGTDSFIYIFHGNKYYSILLNYPDSNSNYKILYNQILATFKFTN